MEFRRVLFRSLSYSVSIGVTEVGRNETAASVLANVETALQSAIDAGGGCLVFHEQNICHVPLPVQA